MQVIIDDCLKMLDEYKEEGRNFDVIINDLTDIPIATSPQGMTCFKREFVF